MVSNTFSFRPVRKCIYVSGMMLLFYLRMVRFEINKMLLILECIMPYFKISKTLLILKCRILSLLNL